jgi:hypothetical protein
MAPRPAAKARWLEERAARLAQAENGAVVCVGLWLCAVGRPDRQLAHKFEVDLREPVSTAVASAMEKVQFDDKGCSTSVGWLRLYSSAIAGGVMGRPLPSDAATKLGDVLVMPLSPGKGAARPKCELALQLAPSCGADPWPQPQDGAFAHFKVFDASASAGCTIYFADGQVDVRLRYPGVAPTLAQAGILRKTPPNSALVGLPVAYFDSVFAEKCGTDADCEPIQLGSSDADVGFRLSAAGVRGGAVVAVWLGFGRIVALHYHCSNLYQIHEYIPYLYF